MRARHPRGPVARLIMFVAAMGLFAAGYYWGNRYQFSGDPPVISGVLVRPPADLPDFELRDANGLPFTLDTLRGRWTLLAFGDLREANGHLTVNRLIDVHNRLADRPDLREQAQLAVASEDESMELARDFSRLTPALKVVAGDPGELARLRGSVGDSPLTATPPEQGIPLYLLDPRARLMAVFPGAQGSEGIAADLSALAARPDLLEPATDD